MAKQVNYSFGVSEMLAIFVQSRMHAADVIVVGLYHRVTMAIYDVNEISGQHSALQRR
jgi:hypothetical protein